MQAIGVVGALASAGGSLAGGMGTSAEDKYKAQQLEREAQYGELRATQTNAQMTRNLSNTLANIDAVRAARHDSPLSPTGAAVRGQTEFMGEEEKGIAVTNILAQAREDEQNAQYLRSASSEALLSGVAGAGAGLFKGLAGAFASGGSGG